MLIQIRQCRSNPKSPRSKGELCAQLTESVHRARSALNEEREKSERLDRKLEAEGRAAKKGWTMTTVL